ncbi:MAG: TetR/AcrR family transcriptional regulator [Nitrolancea sp.]
MKAETGGRERVLIEARRLFLDRGYSEVSMQQIADAVGMTKAALYYHFRDKDDLFASVVVREMSQQRESIEREIEREDSLDRTVERIARLYFDQLSPDSLRMMTDFKSHVPESRHEEVHAELENFVTSITTLFNRAADRHEIRDIQPRMAAFLFFHTLVGYLINSVRDPQITPASDPEAAAKLVASVVLHGIAAPGSKGGLTEAARYHEPAAASGGDTD